MTGLHETELPPGAHLLRLLPDTDPDTGIVVFTARPARRDYVQGQDLLASLGKDSNVTGGGRHHTEDVMLSQAWLLAHEIHTIIVRAAEHTEPGYLTTLHLLANAVGADLIFCRNYDSGQHVIDFVRNHGGTRLAAEGTIATVQQAASPLPEKQPDRIVPLPKHLPQYDFPLFRAACRRALDRAEFERVDAVYVNAFRASERTKPCTDVEARHLLDDLFAACSGVSEAIIVTRAVQAAMFINGKHLKADMSALATYVGNAQHRRLSSAEVRSLRAYREPWRSSAVALADARVRVENMLNLSLSAVSATGQVDGIELHPEAWVFLRAQRLVRMLEGAASTDMLIDRGARYVTRAVKAAGQDLDLAVNPVQAAQGHRVGGRWNHRLGLSVQPVTGGITNLIRAES
jgi:hypothetical protein